MLLYLRFWAGLILAEVAEILGSTPHVIAGRQRRVLRQFQRHLEVLSISRPIAPRTATTTLHAWRDALARLARDDAR